MIRKTQSLKLIKTSKEMFIVKGNKQPQPCNTGRGEKTDRDPRAQQRHPYGARCLLEGRSVVVDRFLVPTLVWSFRKLA